MSCLLVSLLKKKSFEQNIFWCHWPHHQSCSWIRSEFRVFQHPTPSPSQPTGGRSDQMATTSYLAPRVVPSPAKAMWSLSLGGPADSYPPLLLPQLSVLRALTSKWAANFQHPTSMGRHLPFHPASLHYFMRSWYLASFLSKASSMFSSHQNNDLLASIQPMAHSQQFRLIYTQNNIIWPDR